MIKYGLIGKQLSHSFSKQYFESKFEKEKTSDCSYDLFELKEITEFPKLIDGLGKNFGGLNVTIPYKKKVISYLDGLDSIANKIGAVNVIKKENGKLIGYNSDYFGFRYSLENWLNNTDKSALILGTGGASDAVAAALSDLNIPYTYVSRTSQQGRLTYRDINKDVIRHHPLIINTTPLGMYPKVDNYPDLPYHYLTPKHYLFDLVYNPLESSFLKKGKSQGANTINGLEMLEQQAEEAWRIWNT